MIWRKSIRLGLVFLDIIEPYKGLDILYEALSYGIKKGYFDNERIELILAGRGEIKQPWNDLPIKVEMYNAVLSDTDFHQLMADIDLLVLPYKNGTQSGVGMLGAAYGIPLIATRVGALHNLVIEGVNGHLIEPNRSDLLMDIIKKLVNNPKLLAGLRHNAKLCS